MLSFGDATSSNASSDARGDDMIDNKYVEAINNRNTQTSLRTWQIVCMSSSMKLCHIITPSPRPADLQWRSEGSLREFGNSLL